jgi:hypothetical protein
LTALVDKINFVREDRELYAPPADRFVEVDVPELGFLMIDGAGSPEGPGYAAAVQALYSLSYTVKFASKRQLGRDYTVCPLEGLWWSERMDSFHDRAKDEWSWTMMIRQPGWVTPQHVDAARAKAREKAPAVDRVRLDRYAEGLSVQIMHIGPYSAEAPTIARLHDEYLPAHGLVETGHHHEIYVGDPRRSAPEKLRTVLRQPVGRCR